MGVATERFLLHHRCILRQNMGFEALSSVHRPGIPPDAALIVTLEQGMLSGVQARVRDLPMHICKREAREGISPCL